jgi:DNA-binding transcriptional MerR regulator
MLKIGDFAKLARVRSYAALLPYHKLGLLVPEQVDPDSGYHWSSGQR